MQVIMRRVFVFPGQGSQSVGMLAELAAQDRVVADTFAEASNVLGYDLWQVVQQGPAEKLAETVIQQPAMLTAGLATWRYWQARGGFTPDVVCGHSLGEFTALAAAGALDLPTAVGLVKRRAELMQEAVPAGIGAIAAVLGLEDEPIAAACLQAAQGEVVELVNYNSPGPGRDRRPRRRRAARDRCRQGARRQARAAAAHERAGAQQPDASGRRALRREVLAAAPVRSRIRFVELGRCRRARFSGGHPCAAHRQLASPVRWTTPWSAR
jgi:acyl transferase domain-containing protein